MDNIKQFTTTQGIFIIVMIPDGAYNIHYENGHLRYDKTKSDWRNLVGLPEGDWILLGNAFDLTEDQWCQIVDAQGFVGYVDYEPHKNLIGITFYDTASKSGHSILKANGIFQGNTLNPPIERLQLGGGYAMRQSEIEEYKAAKDKIYNPFLFKKL